MVQQFEFHEMEIEGLIRVMPFHEDDNRGSFTKDYSKEIFAENGIGHELQEVFYAVSHKGVIRGMHFQRVRQQAKLVRCIQGHIYDVIVDLRSRSRTFKKWVGIDLTGEGHDEVLVPVGCAHGYLALEESVVAYKCAEKFYGSYDDGIRWDDPDIQIQWPLEEVGGREKALLSDKDRNLQSFQEFMDAYHGF